MADLFHLLCNLTSAVERMLETKRSEFSKPGGHEELRAESSTGGQAPRKMIIAQERTKQSRERRMEIYSKVVELHKEGLTDRAISKALHIGRKTVGRFLRAGQFPERAKPRRPGPRVWEVQRLGYRKCKYSSRLGVRTRCQVAKKLDIHRRFIRQVIESAEPALHTAFPHDADIENAFMKMSAFAS